MKKTRFKTACLMLAVVMAFMAVSVAAGADIKCDGYWCYVANSGINRIIASGTNYVEGRGWHVIPAREE